MYYVQQANCKNLFVYSVKCNHHHHGRNYECESFNGKNQFCILKHYALFLALLLCQLPFPARKSFLSESRLAALKIHAWLRSRNFKN